MTCVHRKNSKCRAENSEIYTPSSFHSSLPFSFVIRIEPVGRGTAQQDPGWLIEQSIASSIKRFFFSPNCSGRLCGPHTLVFSQYRLLFFAA